MVLHIGSRDGDRSWSARQHAVVSQDLVKHMTLRQVNAACISPDCYTKYMLACLKILICTYLDRSCLKD